MQWLFVDTLIPFRFEWRSVDRLVKVLILHYIADSTKMPEAFEAFLSRRCPIIVVAKWTMIDNDVSMIFVGNKYKQNGKNSCRTLKIHKIHKKYKGNIHNGNWIEIATKSAIPSFVGLVSSNQSRLIVKTKTSVPSVPPTSTPHLPLRSNEFAASAVYCKLSRGPPAARNPPPPPAIPGMHVRGLAAVKRGAVIAVLSAIGPSDISNRAPGS